MTTPEENMKATPEDKLSPQHSKHRSFPVKAAIIVAIIMVGVVLLFYPRGDDVPVPPVDDATPPAATEPEPLPPAEDIPVEEEPAAPSPADDPETPAEPEEPPLPTPEESDPLVREQIVAAGAGDELAGFTEGENLVQRLVALVDGSSRGAMLRKILPMEAPDEAFPVEKQGGELFMSQAGYDRYDRYVDAVVALDTEAIVESFHELRPLYEQAYAQLGLEPDELDNAVIRTLDRIIAAPEVEDPIALEQKSVMYTFADPQLESLPAIQKQMLRMGPENTRRLKEKARELREGLLNPGE